MKNIISILLISIFVFPILEKEIHENTHAVNYVCKSNNEKHFHEVTHSCTICNFNLSIGLSFLSTFKKNIQTPKEFIYTFSNSNFYKAEIHSLLSARAPPLV